MTDHLSLTDQLAYLKWIGQPKKARRIIDPSYSDYQASQTMPK